MEQIDPDDTKYLLKRSTQQSENQEEKTFTINYQVEIKLPHIFG